MEEDFVMIPGSGTKKIIRDVKKGDRDGVSGLLHVGHRVPCACPMCATV